MTGPGPAARARLERLALASPLYAGLLRRDPDLAGWLEQEAPAGSRPLAEEWAAFAGPDARGDDLRLERMRAWRRRISLRIAYRSVNELSDEAATVAELSRLAEFCLRECLRIAAARAEARWGRPWDDAGGRPSRFAVLALGKLGGGELNFSSDIDLLFCYEGDGLCRPEDGAPPAASVEALTRMAEILIRLLGTATPSGFLFRVDARLRPQGAWGPLVNSAASLENYYATQGQTWERLALVKARPAAGDEALGAELLDNLHSFRYPRRPPPSLLAEVAAMKRRTEREVVGSAALARNVKLGPGGIREIEFIAQSLQLLHAGAYPFLQTHATTAALEGLARYGLLAPADARGLIGAYWFLRRVEHRIQMREERQTHELPEDPAEAGALAASLGFPAAADFLAALAECRGGVQKLYAALFADREVDADFEAWWDFLAADKMPPAVAARLGRWFGGAAGAAESLRVFVCGNHRRQVTPELVVGFRHLADGLDAVMPELARPSEALAGVARCAERYGSRQQFLNACAANPHLLRALALLADRSRHALELLAARPEILEEIFRPEILRRRKTPAQLAAELGAAGDLWLYLRAEQVRTLVGELLGFRTQREAEAELARLADAALRRLAGESGPLLVALGKYGGGELNFGSDLDLLVIARPGAEAEAAAEAAAWRGRLQQGGPLGPAFAVDYRLRPHGEAGPLALSLADLEAYHRTRGGAAPAATAQVWEKQFLASARVVAGPADLAGAFEAWRIRLLYSAPLAAAEEAAIWAMRARVERDRDPAVPRERAIKTGPGGLMEVEFLVQVLQLRRGSADAGVRVAGTRAALRALAGSGALPAEAARELGENYGFLRRVEFALQRDTFRPSPVLPASAAERAPLARWLGFADEAAFWREHAARMRRTRALAEALRAG
ncbi:MAG TPA: hypothetical protein VHC86_06470 [Opitutaceae bacterium]|nr:hypothetical protein [Opitutaceae bacterium]